MIRAALVGAVLALVACFLLAFTHGALGGTHATFDERLAHGAEWSGVVCLAITPLLFLAAFGVLVELSVQLHSHFSTKKSRYF